MNCLNAILPMAFTAVGVLTVGLSLVVVSAV